MKRTFLVLILIVAAFAGGVYWKGHQTATEPAAKPADEKAAADEPKISRDEEGRVVVKMEDEVQGNIGLLVEKPEAGELNPEVKGFGRVLDPAPLAGLLAELATAQVAYAGTSRELERLKTLSAQGNASDRAVQTAEAAAVHDQIAVQTVKDRLRLGWSAELVDRKDLPALMESLASRKAAIVRIDLPAGENLSAPGGARIFNLAGKSAEGEPAGTAPNVDAQLLGRGFLFIVQTSGLQLSPGEAVTGFLKIPGDTLSGVKISSQSVIRTEGAGWVFVMNTGGDQFTRTKIALDHPIETGWFVTTGVTTNNYVVTTGAQILLSEELKASLKPD